MKILAIETSTEACSAALMIDDNIVEKYDVVPRQHAKLILNMVDQLLAESENTLSGLDALAFGRGPGGFTGVRVATGVIQGLAYGADLPVIPVSTLAALAQSASETETSILAAIDARMGEVYWGLFKRIDENIAATSGEQVSKPEHVNITEGDDWYGVGSGWQTYGELLTKQLNGKIASFSADRFPRASHVLELAREEFNNGNTLNAEQALPVYLRNKVTFQN